MPRKSQKKPPILKNYRVDPTHIGQVIAARRQARGLSMLELSDLAGVSPSTILKLEKGEITIQLDKFLQIVDQLEVPPDHVFGYGNSEALGATDPLADEVNTLLQSQDLENAMLLLASELARRKTPSKD